jgi:hypothetical protein
MTNKEFEERLLESLPTHPEFYDISIKSLKQLILEVIGEDEKQTGDLSPGGIENDKAKRHRNELLAELRAIVEGKEL